MVELIASSSSLKPPFASAAAQFDVRLNGLASDLPTRVVLQGNVAAVLAAHLVPGVQKYSERAAHSE